MTTHISEDSPAAGVDRLCDLVEDHGSAVAIALLWLVPGLALLLAILYA